LLQLSDPLFDYFSELLDLLLRIPGSAESVANLACGKF